MCIRDSREEGDEAPQGKDAQAVVELAGIAGSVVVAVDVVLDELGPFVESVPQSVVRCFPGHFRHRSPGSRVKSGAKFMRAGFQIDRAVRHIEAGIRPVEPAVGRVKTAVHMGVVDETAVIAVPRPVAQAQKGQESLDDEKHRCRDGDAGENLLKPG